MILARRSRSWRSGVSIFAFLACAGAVQAQQIGPGDVIKGPPIPAIESAAATLRTAIETYSTDPTVGNRTALDAAKSDYRQALATNGQKISTDTNWNGTSDLYLVIPDGQTAALSTAGAKLTIRGYIGLGPGNGGSVSVLSGGTLHLSGSGVPDESILFQYNSTASGGAITNAGTISLYNVGFTQNIAGSNGGAIENTGTASLANASFAGNSAGFGGAIYNQDTVSLTDANFTRNSATDFGGAILSNGYATLTDVSFNRNIANIGGALFNGGTVSLTDATFIGNWGYSTGGAIFNWGTLDLLIGNGKTSQFTGNIAGDRPSSITFTGNSTLVIDTASAGLLDMRDPMDGYDATISKSGSGTWALGGYNDFITISSPTDFTLSAGTLYLYGEGEVENDNPATTSVTERVAAGSIATSGTTSVFSLASGASLVAGGDNSITTAGTIALADGAILRVGSATQSLGGTENRAERGGETRLRLDANNGVQLAGNLTVAAVSANDIFTLNADLTNADGYSGNLTKTGSGTVVLEGDNDYSGATTIEAGTLSVSNGAALGSSADLNFDADANAVIVGGVSLTDAAASLKRAIEDHTGGLISDDAMQLARETYAGFITSARMSGSLPALRITGDTRFDGNGTDTDPTADQRLNVESGKAGSIVVTDGAALTFADYNDTSVFGGAIKVNSGAELDIAATLDDPGHISFIGNSAQNGGGVYNAEGTVSLADTSFTGNFAENYGGAIYNLDGTASLVDTSFTENSSDNRGGAIVNSLGTMFLTEAEFTNNSADSSGGAIHNSGGSISLAHATFAGNSSGSGGAISNITGLWDPGESILFVTDTTFTGNSARSSGGAIDNTGKAFLSDTIFTGNSSAGYGGAIENSFGGTLSVTDTTFTGNSAQRSGGAISNYGGTVSVSQTSFANNSSASDGGAILNDYDSILSLADTTFTGNSAVGSGGALFNNFNNIVPLADTSFTNNSAGSYGGAIYNKYATLDFSVGTEKTSLFMANAASGQASSIAFSGASGLTVATASGGLMDMRDPMRADRSTTMTIDKSGTGTWALGGDNDFLAEGSEHTDFTLSAGTLYLYGDGEVENDRLSTSAVEQVAAGKIWMTGETSSFTVSLDASLVAGGENSVLTEGTINLADGATLRGGSAAKNLGGAENRAERGGETSLTLDAEGGVQLSGNLNVAALATEDIFTLDADISAAAGSIGSLTKTGNGTVVLEGTSSYNGGVTVSAGALDIAGTVTSALAVDTGATLAVNQHLIGDATVHGTLGGSGFLDGNAHVYGTLSAGNSPGTLEIGGDLRLERGSTSLFELNRAGVIGGIDNDLVSVGGDLTLSGRLDARVASAGYYRLFEYSGDLTGDFTREDVTSTSSGFTVTDWQLLTDTAQQINLTVNSAGQSLQFWDGSDNVSDGNVDGGSGRWARAPWNWTNETGTANNSWGGSVGIFMGAAGTVDVDGSDSDVGFDTLQFLTDGYLVKGDALLLDAGNGVASTINVNGGVSATIASELTDGRSDALRKAGEGTLILSGNNTYSGGTRVEGGVLSVSSDANLGAGASGLTLDGGTLHVARSGDPSDFASMARDVTLGAAGGGFDIDDNGRAFTLSGELGGPGSLIKKGKGILTLSGHSTYGGDTLVEDGTLIGSSDTIRGDIGNAGTVIFDESADATFAGKVTGLDGEKGQMLKRGTGWLTLADTSTLDWTIERGGLTSATDRFYGNLTIAAGAGFIFDQNRAGTYAGTLSGAGTLSVKGGTIQLSGSGSKFRGLTKVEDATLVIGKELGGSAMIGEGGRLQGAGTLGSGTGSMVTIGAGGTLAPGNSIGTLTIDGDLALAKGSRFEVEVAPGGKESDLIHVTGDASIDGGVVAHIGMTGTYDPTSTYTILSTEGALKKGSAFDAVTTDFAFLDALLSYTDTDVMLSLTRNDTAFSKAAQTANQISTATALDTLSMGNDVFDAVVQLDEKTARDAFDQLSGEIHASALTGLVEDSRHLRFAVNDRMRAAFSGVGVDAAQLNATGLTYWTSGYGSWGSTDSDGNAGSLNRSSGGMLFGADTDMLDNWRIGFIAGYGHSSTDLTSRRSSASVDSYHLGIYGGASWDALSLRTGVAYTRHDIDTRRSVNFLGFDDRLTAGYLAHAAEAFAELGYTVETTFGRFEPFANLAHVSIRTDDFDERGEAAALISSGNRLDTTFTTLGLRGEHAFDVNAEIRGRFTGTIGWRHAFGDTVPTATHAFAGSDTFTVAGGPIAQNTMALDAGIEIDLSPAATLSVSYSGQIASDAQDHGFRANLGITF